MTSQIISISTQQISFFSSTKIFKFGEKGSGVRFHGKVQDFEMLRDQCLSEGRLFEDTEFPAQDSTLFSGQKPQEWPFEWKRPHEVTKEPHLFVGGASRFDVVQGSLGDCWLLAATANLTMNPTLFNRVVPGDQGFSPDKKYAGIFHFRFWRHGKWVEVVIDDRLPMSNNQFVYMRSKTKNEFWSALLEKAYAKLFGSYELLREGKFNEAMEDFTGGVTETFDLADAPKNLFSIMLKAYQRSSFMGCSIPANRNVRDSELSNGLVQGHAYSVTGLTTVHIITPEIITKVDLVRLRNPWGKKEWNGAWSEKSKEWESVTQDEKNKLEQVAPHDGEFWMPLDEFKTNFKSIDVCHLNPGFLEEGGLHKRWEMQTFEGSWIRDVTAGGLNQEGGEQHINPQYRITLNEHDEDDEDELCTLIVSLMQKNSRAQKKMGVRKHQIGFLLYKLDDPAAAPKPLPKPFFERNNPSYTVSAFTSLREVTQRFRVLRGTYCIVPLTWGPGQEAEFLLRVFSEKCHTSEHDDEIQIVEADENAVKTAKEIQKRDPFSELFNRLAGDDLEVDAYELKEILDFALKKEYDFPGFGINCCRGMVAMMDSDRSGKLGMEDFKTLWFDIATWKAVFKMYDRNNSGTMHTADLRAALHSAGYNLHWRVLKVLALRFANKNGTIAIEDFIMCAVKLKMMIEAFKERDLSGNKQATLKLDEFIELTMYA